MIQNMRNYGERNAGCVAQFVADALEGDGRELAERSDDGTRPAMCWDCLVHTIPDSRGGLIPSELGTVVGGVAATDVCPNGIAGEVAAFLKDRQEARAMQRSRHIGRTGLAATMLHG